MELYYLAYLLYIKLTGYHPRHDGLTYSLLSPTHLAQRLSELSPRQKRMAPVAQLIAYLEQEQINEEFEAWLDSDASLAEKSAATQALTQPDEDKIIQASMQAFKALVAKVRLLQQAESVSTSASTLSSTFASIRVEDPAYPDTQGFTSADTQGLVSPDTQSLASPDLPTSSLLSATQAQEVASLTTTKPAEADLAVPSLTTLFKLLPHLTHTPEQAAQWQNLLHASLKLIFPELSATLDVKSEHKYIPSGDAAEIAEAETTAISSSPAPSSSTARKARQARSQTEPDAEKEAAFGIKLDRFSSPTENLLFRDYEWLTRVATKGQVCLVDGNEESTDLLSLALKCHLFNIADLTNVSGVTSRYQLILADLTTKLEHLEEARLLGLSENELLAYIQYSHWQLFYGGLGVLWLEKAGWNELSQLAQANDFFNNHAQCVIDGGDMVLLLVHKLPQEALAALQAQARWHTEVAVQGKATSRKESANQSKSADESKSANQSKAPSQARPTSLAEKNNQERPARSLLISYYSPKHGLYIDRPVSEPSLEQTSASALASGSAVEANSVAAQVASKNSQSDQQALAHTADSAGFSVDASSTGAFSAAQAQKTPASGASESVQAYRSRQQDQAEATAANQLRTPRFLTRAERAALTAQSDLESLLWSAQSPVVNQKKQTQQKKDPDAADARFLAGENASLASILANNTTKNTASVRSPSEPQVAEHAHNDLTATAAEASAEQPVSPASFAAESGEGIATLGGSQVSRQMPSATAKVIKPYPLTLLNPTDSADSADELAAENLTKLTLDELVQVFQAKLAPAVLSADASGQTAAVPTSTSYPALLIPLGKITNRVGLRKVARNGKPGSVALMAGGKVVNYIEHPEPLSGAHVIVCASGSRNIIGRSVYFEDEFVASDSFVLSGIAELLDTRYLYFWLKGRQEELLAIAKEKNRIYSIPAGSFEEVLVPVPSLEVQRAIVAQLEQLEQDRAYHEQELAELDKLEAQLYQGSFTNS